MRKECIKVKINRIINLCSSLPCLVSTGRMWAGNRKEIMEEIDGRKTLREPFQGRDWNYNQFIKEFFGTLVTRKGEMIWALGHVPSTFEGMIHYQSSLKKVSSLEGFLRKVFLLFERLKYQTMRNLRLNLVCFS